MSMDPIVGYEQKGSTHYDRIYTLYKEKKPLKSPLCEPCSIGARCQATLKDGTKFSRLFAMIKAMKCTGRNKENDLRLASAMFNKEKVKHLREDVGTKFKYLTCWRIFIEFFKFAALEHITPSTKITSSKDEDVEEDKREVKVEAKKCKTDGRHAGCQGANGHRALEEYRTKKLRLMCETIDLQMQHVQGMEMHKEIQLYI